MFSVYALEVCPPGVTHSLAFVENVERKLYHFTNFTFGSASATVGTAAGLVLCAEFASGSRYRESKIVSFGGKL